MDAEEKRGKRLKLLEDDIGRALAESQRNGELRSAANFGRPLDFGDGYDQTPAELRMSMKMLKDAGVLPPEVEAMQRAAALAAAADAALAAGRAEEALSLRQQSTDLRLAIALRLEKLRGGSF